MTPAVQREAFPKAALIAAAAVLGFTLVGTAAVRVARLSAPVAAPTAPPAAAAVLLRFSDETDGSIGVHEARSGRVVATIAPDTGGFVRGVLRGMARDRMSRHIGQAPPFRLSQDHRGTLWLQDTATGRLIDLEAFGETNRGAFLTLLQASEARS